MSYINQFSNNFKERTDSRDLLGINTHKGGLHPINFKCLEEEIFKI